MKFGVNPFLCALYLFLLTTALGSADLPRFTGAVGSGKQTLVSLTLPDGQSKWCLVGDSFGGLKLIEVRADLEAVVLANPANEQITLRLQKSAVRKSQLALDPHGLIPLESLNWQWINSMANPMKAEPETLPEWAYRNWDNLDADAKTDLKFITGYMVGMFILRCARLDAFMCATFI